MYANYVSSEMMNVIFALPQNYSIKGAANIDYANNNVPLVFASGYPFICQFQKQVPF